MKEEEFQQKIDSSEGKEKIEAFLGYSNYLRQSDLQRSNELAVKAEQLAHELEETDLELRSITSQSYAYFYHSIYNKAEQLAEKLAKMGKKAGNFALEYYLKDPRAENLMNCYNNLGSCHQQMLNLDEGVQFTITLITDCENSRIY